MIPGWVEVTRSMEIMPGDMIKISTTQCCGRELHTMVVSIEEMSVRIIRFKVSNECCDWHPPNWSGIWDIQFPLGTRRIFRYNHLKRGG